MPGSRSTCLVLNEPLSSSNKMLSHCLNIVVVAFVVGTITNLAEVEGQRQLAGINRRDPRLYSHYEVLDSARKYVLEWVVDWDHHRIVFNVAVQTRGYVGFGLSARGQMDGADIVIGGVDKQGKPYFTDRHGVGTGVPRIDPSQDWQLHSATENRSHTFLSFSRAFDTCDENDYPINEEDAIVLIWAYSESDNPSQYHFGTRGTYPVYLLEPNVVPRPIKVDSFIPGPPSSALLARENLQLWTIRSEQTLPPNQDTVYQCTMHIAPRLSGKHHIVGSHTRLETPQALKHVHHILLYRCTPPANTTGSEFFGPYLNQPGDQCYFLSAPTGDIPTQYCTTIKYGFGIGARIMFYPDHFAVPIGETGQDEYFLMQVHYDNPDSVSVNVRFDIDFYYTEDLRPHDGGLMTVGHHIPGSPSILIPPSSLAHYIHGHCSPECTRTMFPPEGIFISLMVLHTHYSGRKIKVRHFRGKQELPWASNDDNYQNLFQAYRLLNREVNVRPGDQLTVACEYDNTWTNRTVVGGFTTSQEMCLIYIYYYNQLPDYGLCRSEIIDEQYRRYYLGVNNITWDESQLEYVATSPRSLVGRSMSAISDDVNWTIQLREELQYDHINLPQTVACSASPFSSTGQGQVVGGEGTEQSSLATLPDRIREYVPPQLECPLPGNGEYYQEDRSGPTGGSGTQWDVL